MKHLASADFVLSRSRFRWCGTLLALAICTTACDRPHEIPVDRTEVIDLSRVVGELGPLDEANFYTNPGEWEHPAGWTHGEVLKRGCRFRSSDPKMIAQLVALLVPFKFRVSGHPQDWDEDRAIVFHSRAGTDLRILLGGGREFFGGHVLQTNSGSALGVLGDYDGLKSAYAWAHNAEFLPFGDPHVDGACRTTVESAPGARF